ncbi:hypothetical protein Bca101_055646 [Brassica carinata]
MDVHIELLLHAMKLTSSPSPEAYHLASFRLDSSMLDSPRFSSTLLSSVSSFFDFNGSGDDEASEAASEEARKL